MCEREKRLSSPQIFNYSRTTRKLRRHVSRRLSVLPSGFSIVFSLFPFSTKFEESLFYFLSLARSEAHRSSHFFIQKHCCSVMFRTVSRRAAPLLLRQQQRSAGPATARLSYHRLAATATSSSSFQNTSPARKKNQQEQRRSVFIQTESTPNPESLKFVPTGKAVLDNEDGTGYFVSKTDPLDDILRSPLCKELFKVEGVKGK